MPKKMTREEKTKMIKEVSEDIKAGKVEGVQAISVTGIPYSTFNQCFIAHQLGPKGVYGGYRQWIANGRKVKKGEHGYSIILPMKKKDDEDVTYFSSIAVFHFDQTEEVK